MSGPTLQSSRRIRATPYTPRVETLGVSGYSVVNHTILPKGFVKSVEEDYWHLKTHAQLWDVGCQRQVEILGPDAARLVQWMTPRDLVPAKTGQCLYAPLVDERGGMLNDPVILKLAEDHYWLSISDSDILLWARGLALGRGLEVSVDEPDVWPLAVQGPGAEDVVAAVFGDTVRDIPFFRFARLEFDGHAQVVARSGFSHQGGFEIYVDGYARGPALWDALWEAGQAFRLEPGSPNLIERIESGLLSYGNEMTRENNPLECGLERFCRLDGSVDCIGIDALRSIAERGVERLVRGVIFDGESCPSPRQPWALTVEDQLAGWITSAAWSPRFEQNVALGMLERGYWKPGTRLQVACGDGTTRAGVVTKLPMEEG